MVNSRNGISDFFHKSNVKLKWGWSMHSEVPINRHYMKHKFTREGRVTDMRFVKRKMLVVFVFALLFIIPTTGYAHHISGTKAS
jgi:hypothetical protein